LTPHSLRRTFASLLVAHGEDPAYVMEEMGHTTPHLTLSLYARSMQRHGGERERLRALVDGELAATVELKQATDRVVDRPEERT
jgi:integrase